MYMWFLSSSDVCDEKKFENFISIFSLVMSRKSITLYDDQYKFFKAFNSPKLLIAFVEYMFDDVEPEWLSEQEQILFESLRVRMDNQKKKSVAWAIWWAKSHWWWRPENKQTTTEKQQNNKQKTNTKQAKNNQDKDKEEDKEIRNKIEDKDISKEKINKKKFLEFVELTEEEHQKLVDKFWTNWADEKIEKLNNYIWSTWKKYKSHYFTILNRANKETPTNQNQSEMMKERERKRRLEEAREILHRNSDWNARSNENQTVDRRANLVSL